MNYDKAKDRHCPDKSLSVYPYKVKITTTAFASQAKDDKFEKSIKIQCSSEGFVGQREITQLANDRHWDGGFLCPTDIDSRAVTTVCRELHSRGIDNLEALLGVKAKQSGRVSS